MPLITSVGLFVYALVPMLFPQYAYIGLVTGTIIFSVAAGLGEVLISPTIAAIPSDNPERDMSVLHSLYGYGFVGVVIISTLFLKIFGNHNWMYLTFIWALVPVIASVLLMISPMPNMNVGNSRQKTRETKRRTKGIILCMICIFLGAAAENTMSNWISVYMEKALALPKMYGDLLGMTSFAVLLGLSRTLYAKYGRNIFKVLLYGMTSAAVCYFVVALSNNAIVSILACILTGVCTSMLWPGTLILMEENIPTAGVAAYALMAAGGDSGSSIAPQLLGGIVDAVAASDWAIRIGTTFSLSAEQIGLKVGMLVVAIFPILGVLTLLYIKKFFKKETAQNKKEQLSV